MLGLAETLLKKTHKYGVLISFFQKVVDWEKLAKIGVRKQPHFREN
jgi:hypothetical protein